MYNELSSRISNLLTNDFSGVENFELADSTWFIANNLESDIPIKNKDTPYIGYIYILEYGEGL